MALEQANWEQVKTDTPLDRLIGMLNLRMQRLMNLLQRLQRRNTRRVTAATSLTEADDILLVDTTSGGVTVTLPLAAQTPKVRFTVKKVSSDGNTVTIARSGSDTIDYGTSTSWSSSMMARDFESCIVTSPATWGWLIV